MTPHPRLPGTIFTAVEEIEAAGGVGLAIQMDVRDEEAVKAAIAMTVTRFGGIDIVVNNASAINLTNTEQTSVRRFDLMHQVNARGTFVVSKYAISHLKRSANPHILMLSPPLNMEERWFSSNLAYSIAKYGMSMCVLGLAGELRRDGIAVNALWPRSSIATCALKNLRGIAVGQLWPSLAASDEELSAYFDSDLLVRASRTPEIVADAAYAVFRKPARQFTGNFLIDDSFLRAEGISDLLQYRVDPTVPLAPDFFVSEEEMSQGAL